MAYAAVTTFVLLKVLDAVMGLRVDADDDLVAARRELLGREDDVGRRLHEVGGGGRSSSSSGGGRALPGRPCGWCRG
jgi:hypothetical protein